VLLIAAMAGACSSPHAQLPEAPGASSVLFVIQPARGNPLLYAEPLGDGVEFALRPSEDLYALEICETLSQLQLDRGGPLELLDPLTPGARALPTPLQVFRLSGAAFEPAITGPAIRGALPPLDHESCLAAESCAVARPADESTCGSLLPPGDALCSTCTSTTPSGPRAPQLGDPPVPVRLAPCPEGWTETPTVSSDQVAVCDPPPTPPRLMCSKEEAQFFGRSTCDPIGSACPSGRWPLGLGANVIYVDATAAPGGDGTIATPFQAIADAIAVASNSATIAIAPGAYAGSLAIDRSVSLIGHCIQSTSIVASSTDAIHTGNFAHVSIRDLEIVARSTGVHQYAAFTTLSLKQVLITLAFNPGSGVFVEPGNLLSASSLVIRGGQTGITVDGGSADLNGVVIEGATRGLWVYGGTARAVDIAVRDTNLDPGAIAAQHGGSLTLTHAEVEDFDNFAYVVTSAALVGSDLRVSKAKTSSSTYGLVLDLSASATIAGFAANLVVPGVFAIAASRSALRLTDSVIHADPHTWGLYFNLGSRFDLRRTRIESGFRGVHAEGSAGSVQDLLLRNSRLGLEVTQGSTLTASRVRIEGAEQGLSVASSSVSLSDYLDLDAQPGNGSSISEVAVVLDGKDAQLRVVRAQILRALGIGGRFSNMRLLDLEQLDIEPINADLALPSGGLNIADSTVTLAQVSVKGASGRAILLARSSAELSDIQVQNTVEPGSVVPAVDLYVESASRLALKRARLGTGHGRGLEVTGGGPIRIRDLDVMGSGGDGVVLGPAISPRLHAPASLERARIRGAGGTGLIIDGPIGTVLDLEVEGTQGSSAVVIGAAVGTATISRFEVQATLQGAGLDLTAVSPSTAIPRFLGGQIHHNLTGLRGSGALPFGKIFSGVWFHENGPFELH
jgi:hypothetical protein